MIRITKDGRLTARVAPQQWQKVKDFFTFIDYRKEAEYHEDMDNFSQAEYYRDLLRLGQAGHWQLKDIGDVEKVEELLGIPPELRRKVLDVKEREETLRKQEQERLRKEQENAARAKAEAEFESALKEIEQVTAGYVKMEGEHLKLLGRIIYARQGNEYVNLQRAEGGFVLFHGIGDDMRVTTFIPSEAV